MKDLSIRMQRVSSYVNDRAAVYNLSSFLRPDRFFEAVKQAYARKHFKEVNNIALEAQVFIVYMLLTAKYALKL